MSKKEYVISMTVMPWEMEQFIEMTHQLRRNSYYLNLEQDNFIFDVTFNISNEIIDWNKSKISKEFYVDQFQALMQRYDWTSKNEVKIHEDGNYGCVDKRRESTDNCSDESNIIWLDPSKALSPNTNTFIETTPNN